MEKDFIKLNQFGLTMYIFKMTVDELVENTYVDVFNSETQTGYQRPTNPIHYRKISEYLRENDSPILVPTVITAINSDKIKEMDMKLSFTDKMRLVDGQHRVEGFKHLKKTCTEKYLQLKNMEIPVTLLIVDREMNNIHEINTFIDINSKGKKVSTDLAIRLRDQMRKDEGYYRTFDDLVESIATRVAIQLSEEEFTSVWYKAIKIGPEIKGRIISINAFSKSITPIIKIFVDLNKYDFKEINEDEVAQLVEEISGIINGIWNIISDRWSECFIKDIIKFNKKYNIQKGVGVYSLHTLFSQCLKENDKDVMDAIHKFRDIIYNSKVQDYDWIVGGRFSGLSSSGGFDQIINSVKSEIN